MKAVGGVRKTSAIAPCKQHGEDVLIVSCRECQVWWTYHEAMRTAAYWQAKYCELRTKLEQQCAAST